MARPEININDPRAREIVRGLFGDRADVMLELAEKMRDSQSVAPGPAPRDAGKFVRQLATLYCANSEDGEKARQLIKGLLFHAMQLVNMIAEANPEG